MWQFKDKTSGAVITVSSEADAASVRRQREYEEVAVAAAEDKPKAAKKAPSKAPQARKARR